jgi:hypothetical protein
LRLAPSRMSIMVRARTVLAAERQLIRPPRARKGVALKYSPLIKCVGMWLAASIGIAAFVVLGRFVAGRLDTLEELTASFVSGLLVGAVLLPLAAAAFWVGDKLGLIRGHLTSPASGDDLTEVAQVGRPLATYAVSGRSARVIARNILVLGLVGAAALALRPPWSASLQTTQLAATWPAQHAWLWSPPPPLGVVPAGTEDVATLRVDGRRLVVELLAVVLVTALLTALAMAGALGALERFLMTSLSRLQGATR